MAGKKKAAYLDHLRQFATHVNTLIIQVVNAASEDIQELSESLNTHAGNTTKHITADERTAWNGKANASHGTHVTYSASAPAAPGTASAGSASSVSRGDHVHPAQTTVSGNAGSATKLQNGQTLDGVSFDGTAAVTHFAVCDTAAATAAKTVACPGFSLVAGARIIIQFTVTNTAANPTLNVNGTEAKSIMYRGSAITTGYLAANRVYEFVYDGTDFELVGDVNVNTTYGLVSTSANGLAPKRDGSTTTFLRGDGTWAVPPDTNTTYGNMGAATASAAGTAGLVPPPAAGAQGKFLRGDGTWQGVTQMAFPSSGTPAANGTAANGSAATAARSDHVHPTDTTRAAASHNHGAGDITSGTLPVGRGGTGLTASPSMLTNLGTTTAANVMQASPRPGVTGTLSIANGGTGATTAAAALSALGGVTQAQVNSAIQTAINNIVNGNEVSY